MKFNNPELQRVYDESQDVVKEYTEYLSKIDEDIKGIEKVLGELNIEYEIEVEDEQILFDTCYDRIIYRNKEGHREYLQGACAAIKMKFEKSLPDMLEGALNDLWLSRLK